MRRLALAFAAGAVVAAAVAGLDAYCITVSRSNSYGEDGNATGLNVHIGQFHVELVVGWYPWGT